MLSIIVDGEERYLGNNDAPLRYAWKVYGDTPDAPMVARSEWPARITAIGADASCPFLTTAADQDGIGMCNASDTARVLQGTRARQGLPQVELSAGDLYHRISGGSDNGSTLEDAIAAAMSDGIASTAVVPYLDWRKSYSAAEADRKNYRVVLAYLCPTFDHCMSAVLSGFDLSSGVMWYDSYKPDGDGWLSGHGRGSGGGHAVHGYKPTMRGTAFGIWHQNSWANKWGFQCGPIGGLCVFPESMYQSGGVGGWWACRCVVDTESDLPPLLPA